MKRACRIVAAAGLSIFAVTGTAMAQSAAGARPGIGIKAGPSFGSISHKGLLPGELDTRTGLAGGLYLSTGGVIGFGIEGLYAQRGLRSDQSIADAETRLDYIDVPVYLKVTLPTPVVRPFAYAGPQISFEVNCKRSNGNGCGSDSDRPGTTYAGVIGAGVKFGNLGGISIEGRYIYGLTDLKLSTITDSESYKHRTFMILVGIGL